MREQAERCHPLLGVEGLASAESIRARDLGAYSRPVLHLLGIATALALLAAAPCPVTPSPELQSASIDGCPLAACTHAGALEVCSCTQGEEAEAMRLGLRRGGAWISEIATDASVWGFAGLRVTRADLDGDGAPEIVCALLRSFSNGMAVERWEYVIWDGAHPSRPPVSFAVEDPRGGPFSRSAGEPGCRVLATSWEGGSDRVRGDGLYLRGRWSRYAAGVLRPLGSPGILSRRLLRSFWDERGSGGTPLQWLRDRRAERRTDPLLPTGGRSRTGTVTAIDARSDRVDLAIAFDDGTSSRYCYGRCPDDDHGIAWLADGVARVAYPKRYWSSELLAWPFESKVTLGEPEAGTDERVLLVEPTEPVCVP